MDFGRRSLRHPGLKLIVEPLAGAADLGLLLEAEINENGQDAVERRIVNQSIVPNPVDGLAYPGADGIGAARLRPVDRSGAPSSTTACTTWACAPIGEDLGRGGNDAFGRPLSLSRADDEEPRRSELQPRGR